MKKDKVTPILLAIVLILLIGEFVYSIYHQTIFQDKVEDGNVRWKQVEEILNEYDIRIDELEELCSCGRGS